MTLPELRNKLVAHDRTFMFIKLVEHSENQPTMGVDHTGRVVVNPTYAKALGVPVMAERIVYEFNLASALRHTARFFA